MAVPLAGIGLGLQAAAGVGSFVSGVVGSRQRRRRLGQIVRGQDPVIDAQRQAATNQANRSAFAQASSSGANPALALREAQQAIVQAGQATEDRLLPVAAQRQEAAASELENRRQQRLQQGLGAAGILLNTVGTGMAIQGAQQKPGMGGDATGLGGEGLAGLAAPLTDPVQKNQMLEQAGDFRGVNPEQAQPVSFADFASGTAPAQQPEAILAGVDQTLAESNLGQTTLQPGVGLEPQGPEAIVGGALQSFGLPPEAQQAFFDQMTPEDIQETYNAIIGGDTGRAEDIIDNFMLFYQGQANTQRLRSQAAAMGPLGLVGNGIMASQAVV